MRTKNSTWRMKDRDTKMSLMVRRQPPMSQSEFEDDTPGESCWRLRYGGKDATKICGPW